MFPAALPSVVSVGALDQSGRADFSNFGGWVDCCAPGVDVVSTFFSSATDEVDGFVRTY
jgi:subtilisin family serine protease